MPIKYTSEVIQRLRNLKDQYGDLEVIIFGGESIAIEDYEIIVMDTAKGNRIVIQEKS